MNVKSKVFLVLWVIIGMTGSLPCLAVDQLSLEEVQKGYPAWAQSFMADYKAFAKKVHEKGPNKPLSEKEVGALFKNSVAPNSKMLLLLTDLATHGGTEDSPYDPGVLSFGTLTALTLTDSAPVGFGGFFDKEQGWAIYIDVKETESMNPYAKNKVPQNGQLVRDVYPFVVFNKIDGKLKLQVLSKEFVDVLRKLSGGQYS
jgi:hypothetical protein